VIPEHRSGSCGGNSRLIAVSVFSNREGACTVPIREGARSLLTRSEPALAQSISIESGEFPACGGGPYVRVFSEDHSRRLTTMPNHDLYQQEIPWHALLNAPEARVLMACEERELLVELVDCRNRILATFPEPNSEPAQSITETGFQRRVRELASCPEGLDPLFDAIRPVAMRYQQIRSKLALANVRLVAHVAKPYQGRGIPPADLIQEGICSLLAAIDRFDVVNETRLATYAIWWIRQGIQRAIAAGAYPVRLNPRLLLRLAQHGHREGDDAWTSRGDGKRARRDAPESATSDTLDRLLAATRPTLSLDAPNHCDGVTAVVDFFVPGEDDDSEAADSDESVGVLIENLDPREQLVLTLRFGLKGKEQQTLVQVSKVLGVSKERVRQIEARALQKLREGTIRSGRHLV
jgi:RNA polymerase primary sigma factor